MLEVAAFFVIGTLYIIPANVPVYSIIRETVESALLSQDIVSNIIRNLPFLSYLIGWSVSVAAAFLYALFVAAYFEVIYLLLRLILMKYIFVFNDIDIDEKRLDETLSRGQSHINRISRVIILIVLLIHVFLGVYDIKLFVLCILSSAVIFSDIKINPIKDKQVSTDINVTAGSENEGNTLTFEWPYNCNLLGIERPVMLFVKIPFDMARYTEYQGRGHQDNFSQALKEYVLNGLCPEVTELANQLKKLCNSRGFSTYHQVSAVMALQQSFRYVYDINSKGQEEYIRYPLETLIDREGDCDCHSICAAAILYSMGYEIVLLRITLPDASGHLAIAVEGADGIPGNFLNYENRKYYYCEVTPAEGNFMNYKVGEMPEMPGANIVVVPVKKMISNV